MVHPQVAGSRSGSRQLGLQLESAYGNRFAASWQPGAPPRTLVVEAPDGWTSSFLADLHAVALVVGFAVIEPASVVEFAVSALAMADASAGD